MFSDPNPYHLRNITRMPERCAVCGQATEVEVGFYYGTGYVSYALSLLLSALSFILWTCTIGISLKDNRIFWWLGCNILLMVLLQPLLMRLSRSIWITFFVKYSDEPPGKEYPKAA